MNRPSLRLMMLFALLQCCSVSHADQKICLDGICVGDTLSTAKAAWKEVNRKYLQSKLLLNDARRVFPAANDKQQFYLAANIGSSGIDFDRVTLAEFINVSPVCRPTALIGRFESKSGKETTVYYYPASTNDSIGSYRAVKIERVWAVSREEFAQIQSEVTKTYGAAYSGNEVWKHPVSLSLHSGSTAILTLLDVTYPNPDSDEFDGFSRSFLSSDVCGRGSALD